LEFTGYNKPATGQQANKYQVFLFFLIHLFNRLTRLIKYKYEYDSLLLFTYYLFYKPVSAQIKFPVYPDSLFSTYYLQKASFAENLPETKNATDSPDSGTWNNLQSKVWVNTRLNDAVGQGIEIAPPLWEHAGQKGNSEIPLIGEGYSYRKPTKIFLHKGWNKVLIKAPVGTFKGKDWQNPVKWEFTFLPVTKP